MSSLSALRLIKLMMWLILVPLLRMSFWMVRLGLFLYVRLRKAVVDIVDNEDDRISIETELASLFKQYQRSDSQSTPTNESSNQHVVIDIETNSRPAPPSAHIPPPPPPPPAPAPPQPRENVLDIIRKNKSQKNATIPKKLNAIDMTEVLKGMKTVQLRKVARSPGGRPIRQPPNNPEGDLASVFNRALQKKFGSDIKSTPTKGKNLPGESSGWSPTGICPGPHLLKSSKRATAYLQLE